MEQQHYFPPLHGAVDCEKCEVRDCWCRGKFQRNRRNMPHTSGRCPRLPDLCGFVEKEERELYIGASAAELRKEALQLHIDRVFDNPQWGGYLPFNKRYRPEVWRAAHIVYVRNECCHKISPVTQEQIDHAYNGTIPCPHCGRWSEFIVLGIRLQPEPLVPCLNCDCHDPDMGCTMPSIDKSYACPLVSCDDEQTEVLDE